MTSLAPYLLSPSVKIFLAFLISGMFIRYAIPVIVRIAKAKKIFDMPNGRTSHQTPTPRLGGVGVFLSVLLISLLVIDISKFPQLQYALAGSIILFFIGLKDDILSLSPWKKLGGQLLATAFIVFFADIRFTSIHGFFGLHEISYIQSVIISFFVIILIINAFNLIDGVDGLSGSLAIVSFAVLGVWFYLNKSYEIAIICSSMTGSLGAFLVFNIWAKRRKVFLGDTGALFIGYLLAIFIISFCEMNASANVVMPIKSVPVIAFTILIVPLLDTARIFLVRILQGRSPFSADKNHIHHYLLDLGLNHLQVTTILVTANIFFIMLAYLLQNLNIYLLTGIIVLTALTLSSIPVFIYEKRARNLPWQILKPKKKNAA